METYQERVVAEKNELDVKIKSLRAFINSDEYNEIKENDQVLLCEQYEHMAKYTSVLSDRIKRF
jgi:hypothetical protein